MPSCFGFPSLLLRAVGNLVPSPNASANCQICGYLLQAAVMKMLTYDLNFGYCHRPFGELWYMSSNRTLSIQTILLLKKSTLTVSRSLGEKNAAVQT
jgi:hypothetical protein